MDPTGIDDMEIQALVFDARKYDANEAKTWAREQGYRVSRAKVEGGQIVIQQEARGRFRQETFRLMTLDDGVQAILAVPKRVRYEQEAPKKRRTKKAKPFSWQDPIGWIMEKYFQ